MADGLKMLLKEDFKPPPTTSFCYASAPWLAIVPVLLVFAVVPFGGMLDPGPAVPGLADWFGGRTYPMQIAQLDAGVLVVLAIRGIGIIGTMLAGWSSNNKFSMLGAAARGLADDLLRAGDGPDRARPGPDLRHRRPGRDGAAAVAARCWGILPAWGIVYQPFAAILFLTAAIAENKRIPFDLPEASRS